MLENNHFFPHYFSLSHHYIFQMCSLLKLKMETLGVISVTIIHFIPVFGINGSLKLQLSQKH